MKVTAPNDLAQPIRLVAETPEDHLAIERLNLRMRQPVFVVGEVRGPRNPDGGWPVAGVLLDTSAQSALSVEADTAGQALNVIRQLAGLLGAELPNNGGAASIYPYP